ncbi:hypothetical protein EIP86_010340 [Pleurotus ostreatoroseus]|nr:hypothetical protein EIP86_010340 [Pleurotus ostreatoroseus]
MSNYGQPPPNPDSRPLPPGWTQQYDWNYKTWFYVNTSVNPPQSSWTHPAAQGFAPPPGPPPPGGGYPSPGYGQGPPPQQYGQGYGAPSYQGGYQQGPPQQEQRGWFGGSPAPPQQNVVYEQARPQKKSGPGWGTVALAGGGALIGGMLLEDAIDDHDDRIEEQAYDQGFENGEMDNFDGGGGDW